VNLPSKLLAVSLLALSACANPELEKEVADLKTKVETLQKEVDGLKAGGGARGAAVEASPEAEQAAGELFRLANEAAEAGKYDEAKGKLAELKQKYGETRAAKRAGRLESELAVVGIDAGQLETEKWYVGNGNFTDGEATLVVFWETWCPHCQREVPKLEEMQAKYKSQGLNIVALTKVTRSSSDEKVEEFIKEHKLSFPVGKEKNGSMSERFGVQGIPAAAVIKDGKVVWRGHPARLTDDMIGGWLS
jgi:thiol-disulfide isomerase/thioredoxin